MNKLNPNTILIIRLSSIGDVLLTTPLLRILKKKFPDALIDYITTERNFDILKLNPNLNNLIKYDKSDSLKETINFKKNVIKYSNYDMIVDLQNNLRSRILTLCLKSDVFRFSKRRILKLKMVYLKRKISEYLQIPDLYINSLNGIDIHPDRLGLEFWLEQDITSKYYPYKNENINVKLKIAIAPGAYHYTKRLPKEKYIEICKGLINELNAEIVLLGGADDVDLCNDICSSVMHNCESFAGKGGLAFSADLINDCDLTITNDTSIMHISAARQVPVIAIFGSTVPEFGFSPYKSKNYIIEYNIPCRPCTHIGKKKCPKGHFNCMNNIEVKHVLSAVKTILT